LHSRCLSINEFNVVSKTFYHLLVAGWLGALTVVCGAEAPAKFLGAQSCASTSCHGGGGAKQNQLLVWSLKDFHSHRPAATLATARSKQIASVLDIKDPTADVRCTTCHAPLHEVSETLRGENFKVSEGVSCESCHGAAENWIRAHTRKDFTSADRLAAGLRDLPNLYVRANTCVACHQNVDNDILKAGHPELIFELDGQSVAEPKHWSAEKNGNGAQAWLVGQAVALREMSWQLANEKSADENLKNRWLALDWLLTKTSLPIPASPGPWGGSIYGLDQSWGDEISRKMAGENWSSEMSHKILSTLAATSAAFRDNSISQNLQARRAERLVLALDRLIAALAELKNNEPLQSSLNQLFKLAQSIPDFEPPAFATALDKFAAAIGKN
jgi:Cytochrome c554 and c-prime